VYFFIIAERRDVGKAQETSTLLMTHNSFLCLSSIHTFCWSSAF
jgi:hypothetical protein